MRGAPARPGGSGCERSPRLNGAVRFPQVQVVQDPATGRTFILKVGNGSGRPPPPSRSGPGSCST